MNFINFLTRTFILLFVFSATETVAWGEVLAGPITNPANGHEYYLLTNANWTTSEAEALTLGGNLVTINDAAENRWVFDTFAAYGGVDRMLWIGLNDLQQTGVYTWANGEPLTYSNWEVGQPSSKSEHFVLMYSGNIPPDGLPRLPETWNDYLDRSDDFISGSSRMLFGVVEVESMGQRTYSVTDLGDLPGGDDWSRAHGINDAGQTVGTSSISTVAGTDHGFVWDKNGGMQDIGFLGGGGNWTIAYGINNNEQVVGFSEVAAGTTHAFIWDANGGMLDIATDYSAATGINDSAQVVGWISTTNGFRAFLWDSGGGMQDLGTLFGGTGSSFGNDVNNSGQVIGESFSSGSTIRHAFLWEAGGPKGGGGMMDIGRLPGGTDDTVAFAINNGGQVVGMSNTTTGNRAFVWDPNNGMQDLGDLPGGNDISAASSINESGQVVGQSHSTDGNHAFLWDASAGMQDLNETLDSSGNGWTLESATGINELGQIVGWGINPNGATHGYLLTISTAPDTVVPDSFEFIQGEYATGSLADLGMSDDLDLSGRRRASDIQSRVFLEVRATCSTESPSSFEFTLEASVFARREVVQTVELYDYGSGSWEQVDSRNANRFNDSVTVVTPNGDLARFVEPGTKAVAARVLFMSLNPRQQFAANIDQTVWRIE